MSCLCCYKKENYSNQTHIPLKKDDTLQEIFPDSNVEYKNDPNRKKEQQLYIFRESESEPMIFDLKNIFGEEEVSLTKASFGKSHALFLFTGSNKRTYLAGYGSNTHGQLGLPVKNREKFDDDFTSLNVYPEIRLIFPKSENYKFLDIATGDECSYILKEDPRNENKSILTKFELNEEDLYNMGSSNITKSELDPKRIIHVPKEILKTKRIFANKDRVLILNDDSKKIFLKGLSFNLDCFDSFHLLYESNIPIKELQLGEEHILILLENNTLLSCGYNEYGQLGIKSEEDNLNQFHKLKLERNPKIKKISSGLKHNMIFTDEGIFYFGDNSSKQCLGAEEIIREPELFQNSEEKEENVFEDIICGGLFSIGINKKGEAKCWGDCNFLFKSDTLTSLEEYIIQPKTIVDLKFKKIVNIFTGEKDVCFFIE
ncbi:MAG: hypothetical protein MJ252_03255 [archaeon]|nr:hypothetical protein [archaeon]